MTGQDTGAIEGRGRLLLAALFVGIGLAVLAAQAIGSFGKARGYPVGSSPSSVAIGEFNGDGKRDLAVANSGSGNVSILLGNGAGSFGKARNFAAGAHPNALAIGKLNGDAKRDLALADGAGVSILLGRGDGSFGPPASFAAGGPAISIAIGDFDGAGGRDLAVVNYSGVSVLPGRGDGSFGSPTSYAVGINPWAVVVGNFSADADFDLAVANGGAVDCEGRVARAQTSSCVGGFGTVSVLLGRGDGTFGAAAEFPVGSATQPVAMVVGDFNADPRPDLALVDYFQYANSVAVLLGRGDGSFGRARFSAVGSSPNSIAVGDINQDSRDDLAVTSSDSPKTVSVLLGRGEGAFRKATDIPIGAGGVGTPTAVAIGNLNAGLNPDLAVAIRSSGGGARNRVAVLLNGGPSRRHLTLAYDRGKRGFAGRLSSADPACVSAQRVTVLRRRSGPDLEVARAVSTADGSYRVGLDAGPGAYYARVRAWSACRAATSKLLTLRP